MDAAVTYFLGVLAKKGNPTFNLPLKWQPNKKVTEVRELRASDKIACWFECGLGLEILTSELDTIPWLGLDLFPVSTYPFNMCIKMKAEGNGLDIWWVWIGLEWFRYDATATL